MLYELSKAISPLRYWLDSQFFNLPYNAKHKMHIKHYKGRIKDKPILIIGNGPSLNKTPLDDFQDVYSIGMNKINLLFPKVKWRPNVILSNNLLVILQNQNFFGSTNIPVFLSWKMRWLLKPKNRGSVHYYLQSRDQVFSCDISVNVGAGATITYSALQMAYYLGANPVILFGVDHTFQAKGPANKVIITKDKDVDHFDPNYFGKGTAWQLPDFVFTENAYARAKKAFEEDNRTVYDASINGKLDIFEKISVTKAKTLCGLD